MTTTSTEIAGHASGYTNCRCGHRHWGAQGAAGLVLLRRHHGQVQMLMQLRSPWVQLGNTWSVPGGALDVGEDVFDGAVREATEEGIHAEITLVGSVTGVDHVDWSYEYVIAWADGDVTVSDDSEAAQTLWVNIDYVHTYELHPGFTESWTGLHATIVQHVI
jgi:8-oxo-dGTP diphosphatase